MKKIRVAVAAPEYFTTSWRWVARHFGDYAWFFYIPGENRLLPVSVQRAIASLKAVVKAVRCDLLVSHGPYMAFYCAVFKWLFGIHPPHIVYSFNFAELPTGLTRKRMQFAFQRIDIFVVSSSFEVKLYSEYFKIPEKRFNFVRWGINYPVFKNIPPHFEGDYICAVGGNARDYATFIKAMRNLPEISAIIVVRPHNVSGLKIPHNVKVLTNIPLDEAYSVIADSRLMVLPLAGKGIPCGHVTLVVAMYLGVPSIVTDSAGVDDYIRDGETGLLCPPASAEGIRLAIQKLWNSPELCADISKNGVQFAQTCCSERNYVIHFRNFIETRVGRND